MAVTPETAFNSYTNALYHSIVSKQRLSLVIAPAHFSFFQCFWIKNPSENVAGVVFVPFCVCVVLFLFLLGLAEDDQDCVRLQTVDNCSALARVLPTEGQKEHVLPVVLDTSKDK